MFVLFVSSISVLVHRRCSARAFGVNSGEPYPLFLAVFGFLSGGRIDVAVAALIDRDVIGAMVVFETTIGDID